MSDIVKGHVAPGYERVREIYQQVSERVSNNYGGTRLRRIITCIGPNQKNQPNLDLYLVLRYKICLFPIVVLYLCIDHNQKI